MARLINNIIKLMNTQEKMKEQMKKEMQIIQFVNSLIAKKPDQLTEQNIDDIFKMIKSDLRRGKIKQPLDMLKEF